jgi:hypothetical protein
MARILRDRRSAGKERPVKPPASRAPGPAAPSPRRPPARGVFYWAHAHLPPNLPPIGPDAPMPHCPHCPPANSPRLPSTAALVTTASATLEDVTSTDNLLRAMGSPTYRGPSAPLPMAPCPRGPHCPWCSCPQDHRHQVAVASGQGRNGPVDKRHRLRQQVSKGWRNCHGHRYAGQQPSPQASANRGER